MIRSGARRHLLQRLDRRTEPVDRIQLCRAAVVLAPHPDDETLGCGGLIALKRKEGANVEIVFMTDGAASHAGTSRTDLVARRMAEATAACDRLGVADDCLHFLGLPDGDLSAFANQATDAVTAILHRCRASQLIVPHPAEPPPDHRATYLIAEAAARHLGTPVDALLYPVWMWDQWPWTNPLSPPRARTSRRQVLSIAMRGRLGHHLTRQLTVRTDVSSVLGQKRHALEAHESQMRRPPDRPDWPILGDIAGGEWLNCLMGKNEYYSTATFDATGVGT